MGSGVTATAAERGLLWLLCAFSLLAVVGFAAYGLHPERLAHLAPAALAFYAVSFALFAQGQVWLGFFVLAFALTRRVRLRWLSAFAAVYAVSLASELAGTTWGLPFGAYSYGSGLGHKWLDRVPVVIPLSWFAMALPSYALARAAHPASPAATVALGSLVLLCWDLALDPAMSAATRYWVWGHSGPYYGMPWMNLFGWYVTGVLLMALLAWRDDGWVAALPLRWLLAFYGANVLLAVGMCAAAGLHGAWLATAAVAAVLCAWVALRVGAPARPFLASPSLSGGAE
jgi:putative membrane protein